MAKQLKQEEIDKIIERLVERSYKANEIFLKKIGSTLDEMQKLRPTEAYQLAQMLKYGNEYQNIIKELDKYTALNIKDIDAIFENYAKRDGQFYKDFYKYRNIPFVEYKNNNAIRTQTEALANVAKNEMYDFTRSNVLGYTIRDILPDGKPGKIMFKGLRETYNNILDIAMMNINQGKLTFDQAMKDILTDIGLSGLKTIQFGGRSMRLDSAIRMHLNDRLGQLHNENQKIYGNEFDADGYEISVHLFPAVDHAPVQGKQFSIEQYNILDAGGTAKDYKGKEYTLDHDSKNGYRPISTMNCYHYIFPIILGVSNPEYTDEQLKQILDDNEKGFEYNGKHYTLYEGTQLQRSIERKVREQKDIQILAKESGNSLLMSKAQTRIKQLSNDYNTISSISGLPTRMDRMRVSDYKRKAVGKNLQKYMKNNDKNVVFVETLNLDNDDILENKINEYRQSIIDYKKENAFIIDKDGDAFYIKGQKANVVIPDWIDQEDAIVIHNHPMSETEYSFSKADIIEFLENRNKRLYADDEIYKYMIEKTTSTKYELDQFNDDWLRIYAELGEKVMSEGMNDKDREDYIVAEISKLYNFIYNRDTQTLIVKKR